MKRIKLLIILVVLISHFKSISQSVWTVEPMLHYNFGGKKRHFSFAFEIAYWNFTLFVLMTRGESFFVGKMETLIPLN